MAYRYEDVEHAWQVLAGLGCAPYSPAAHVSQLLLLVERLGVDPSAVEEVAREHGDEERLVPLLEGLVVGLQLGRGARQPAAA